MRNNKQEYPSFKTLSGKELSSTFPDVAWEAVSICSQSPDERCDLVKTYVTSHHNPGCMLVLGTAQMKDWLEKLSIKQESNLIPTKTIDYLTLFTVGVSTTFKQTLTFQVRCRDEKVHFPCKATKVFEY